MSIEAIHRAWKYDNPFAPYISIQTEQTASLIPNTSLIPSPSSRLAPRTKSKSQHSVQINKLGIR